jgi:predicted Zn-dependent peptidase
MVGVGSRYENQQNNGISHFLEHMAFKGTDTRPTTLDIAAAVDNVGGESNAFTGKEYTGYYIKVAAKEVDMAIELLQDMLFNSRLLQEEVERERGVIVEEINMYRDSPRDVVSEMYDALLFPDQPLGMEVAGTPQSLASIGHEQLAEYNRRWYVPSNMVIGVSGAFDADAIATRLETAFAARDNGELAQYTPATWDQSSPAITVKRKEFDQTQLIVGWRSYPLDHPKRYALGLLNVVMGGNMSSRLFTEVRERRGLAYAVHSGVDDFLDAGSFSAQAGLGHKNVPQALDVILQQFTNVRDKGISAEELDRAKRYLIGRMALSMEDNLSTTIFHSRQWLLESRIRTIEEILQAVDAVTLSDISEVANELFVPGGLNIAAIGPAVDQGELQRGIEKHIQ